MQSKLSPFIQFRDASKRGALEQPSPHRDPQPRQQPIRQPRQHTAFSTPNISDNENHHKTAERNPNPPRRREITQREVTQREPDLPVRRRETRSSAVATKNTPYILRCISYFRLLEYPPNAVKNKVTIYNDDLRRLDDEEFLNDTIIEFYLKYIHDNLPESMKDATHFFNTFFWTNLNKKNSSGYTLLTVVNVANVAMIMYANGLPKSTFSVRNMSLYR